MQDLIIITDKPITPESCSEMIIKQFKKRISVLSNDSETLYMKRKRRGFELWFSPNDQIDNKDFFMEDVIEKVPNKKAYLTNLCYTDKDIAKEMIDILKPFYGTMWIQSDEEDDWFGSADDFINVYCADK